MIGASQKRLRTFKKSQSSFNMDNFDIALLKLLSITFVFILALDPIRIQLAFKA